MTETSTMGSGSKWRLLLRLVVLVSFCLIGTKSTTEENSNTKEEGESLWDYEKTIAVVGPSHFPKPTDKIEERGAVPVVKPLLGKHRPDTDAVFAYCEGYPLAYYLFFIETLRSTGFGGDVVLAIAEKRFLVSGVLEYLESQENVVVYTSDMDCFADDRVTPASRKVMGSGHMDIFQMCKLHDVYGWTDDKGKVIKKAKDPREGRVVATLRYEWYWIWNQHYNPNQWIMVLDARDSYFQRNPFEGLPRHQDPNLRQGRLYFFGENTEATRLGKSTKNVNWLRNGYGRHVLEALRDKPTICSGSTMGEQVAMEQYLRALVNEKDESTIRMTGADQGFHNYLYYSHKLANVLAIESLTVFEQGRGIINNLGALRKKPLSEWGNLYNGKTHEVFNWDGLLSPVVHQWDRDKDLFHFLFKNKFRQVQQEWEQRKQQMVKAKS